MLWHIELTAVEKAIFCENPVKSATARVFMRIC